MSRLFAIPPWLEVRRRLLPLITGLVLCGVAYGCIVSAGLGLDPWDVLHQGISDRTGIPIGTVSVLVSFVVILGWIPLRQRLGLGTVLNAILIGLTMDVVLLVLPEPGSGSTLQRWGLLVAGLVIAGPGIGMYIGARLGPGPRDGIMTGLAERGPSIRVVRTGIELTALAAGWALGGTIGIGTLLFALSVGPNVQFWLARLDLGFPPGFEPVVHPDGHHADDPPPDVEPDFTISGS
ncbi:MAG: integral rane protein [Ilumatobacteraceae bacterium]|nr:integral rane protein [Ilumatobacteraceae bacterium]